jgi:hypothetical protein
MTNSILLVQWTLVAPHGPGKVAQCGVSAG